MRNVYRLIIVVFVLAFINSCNSYKKQEFSTKQAKQCLDFAMVQYEQLYNSNSDHTKFPRGTKDNGTTKYTGVKGWTSGFFPGSLWYLYEYSNDEKFKEMAENSTAPLEILKTYTGTHDIGFMLYCSFGNGLRLTGNEEYKEILKTGAKSLASRYNPLTKTTLSWNSGKRDWQFPVIIDNMMNLELLFWAAKHSDNKESYNIATSHANTTLKNHYREDYSSYHVVDYDTTSGEIIWLGTHQGANDSSSWARGQSWGLYGFTMSYRETKDEKYLKQAENAANYILSHPNMPEDLIPFWDFNAPNIPNEERDASAASIMASALLELGQYVENPNKSKYLNAAEKILANLSSDQYLAKPGENNLFILKHSVGNKNKGSEVDTPLNYADYYYIEALLRYIAVNN